LVLLTGTSQQALLFERADRLRADPECNLFAIDNYGFGLQVRLPDFFSVALRKADIAAVLFAFAGEFASIHNDIPCRYLVLSLTVLIS
jgi:hypothetical protein